MTELAGRSMLASEACIAPTVLARRVNDNIYVNNKYQNDQKLPTILIRSEFDNINVNK